METANNKKSLPNELFQAFFDGLFQCCENIRHYLLFLFVRSSPYSFQLSLVSIKVKSTLSEYIGELEYNI